MDTVARPALDRLLPAGWRNCLRGKANLFLVHRYHVCVDISQVALQEARAKLAGKGACCIASITGLPFRDGVFDGIVSAYTVQHIDKTHQGAAIAELYPVANQADCPNRFCSSLEHVWV